jgi:hypothetical protein
VALAPCPTPKAGRAERADNAHKLTHASRHRTGPVYATLPAAPQQIVVTLVT